VHGSWAANDPTWSALMKNSITRREQSSAAQLPHINHAVYDSNTNGASEVLRFTDADCRNGNVILHSKDT